MTTMTMMDNGQILIRKANLSLRLRWAKKEFTCIPSMSKSNIPDWNKGISQYTLFVWKNTWFAILQFVFA